MQPSEQPDQGTGRREAGQEAREMEHQAHRPGTVNGCRDCVSIAYEPSWYAALAAFLSDDLTVIEEENGVSAST
jgi:hypothetical protein